MYRNRGLCRWILTASLLLLAGSMLAQQVVVRPQQAVLQPGQGQQFEAQLFDNLGRPVRGATYTWSVEPATLGAITGDGYFVAGQQEGIGRALVSARSGSLVVRGSADVVVGPARGSEAAMRLVVEPGVVELMPGQTQQFRAVIQTREGRTVPAESVRWEVIPPALGTITPEGLFTAGNLPAVGQVVALVAVERKLLRGAARVMVRPHMNAVIAGRVVNEADSSPVPGAVVTVQGLGALPWCAQDTTTEEGDYEVAVPAPGLYVVRAEARGFVPEYFDNARSLPEATPISVAQDDTVTAVNFALSRGGAISGLVAAELDSTPLPGAHVQAYLPLLPHVRYHAVADQHGEYVIAGLAGGSYVVEATAVGYRGEFYTDAPTMRQATLVEVTETETTTGVDFYLQTSSAITGRVLDAVTGAPIALAHVCAHSAGTSGRGTSEARVLTDSSGCYTLGVSPGTYYVEARAQDYAAEWFDGVTERRLATPVLVVSEQHTSGIDFHLSRLGAISGLVTDQGSGAPIAGAVVTAYREGPGAEPSPVRTDEHGMYLISGLQPGNYFVRAVAEGYLAEWYCEASSVRDASLVAVAGGDTSGGIDFTLSGGGSITGTVRSKSTGQPIAGARVEVTGATGPFMRVTFTGEDGAYAVTGLPSGGYFVHASARNYLPVYFDGVSRRAEATPVVVNAPEATTGIDFSLPSRFLEGGAIAGRVTDGRTGQPLRGARVYAVPMTPGQVHHDNTDSTGLYVLRGLQPGRYLVWAFKSGYLIEFYEATHSWWLATPVTIGAGEQVTGIDFALTPQARGPFALAGRVMDKGDLPSSGALVLVHRAGELVATVLCSEDGSYLLEELPPGQYEVCAQRVGQHSGGPAVTLTLSSEERSCENLNLLLANQDGPAGAEASLPQTFALVGAFPNPFNPSTEVRFELPGAAEVSIIIYNVLGQPVRTVFQGVLEAGRHAVTWDGRDQRGVSLASGVYLCRLEAQTPSGQRHLFVTKMLLAQ
ncbi:MAG: carboxypeptidase regulatory-like domain-containing protein [candidate division KSB1 bacterium]|nr:carboxypeptidase regulatory-like domain-containing protein [candidate division KSB1 bacterium]